MFDAGSHASLMVSPSNEVFSGKGNNAAQLRMLMQMCSFMPRHSILDLDSVHVLDRFFFGSCAPTVGLA